MTLPRDFPPEIAGIVRAVQPYTMTSPERLYALIRAVEYIVRTDVPGAIVECGVWKGGSMMAAVEALLRHRRTDRDLYLFDTFSGMPPASSVDRDLHGRLATDLLNTEPPATSCIWAVAPLDEVRQNLATLAYPADRIHYVEGRVEDTVPALAPDRIALLRLDTDWYESTRHELVHLFPRLSPGGVLLIDDYGHWEGCRRAVDEYIEAHRLPLLLCRIDYTGRIAVKPLVPSSGTAP